MKPLKILISNDDGIFALGIRTLANTLAEAGHEVTVVCPDRERSATGHGLTMHRPIRAEVVENIFDPQVTAWSCSGTPSDCVKFALSAVLESYPDFVISGINHGSNLGTDVLYSGTVSAAMEGTLEGIPSIAISLASFSSREFQPGANFACNLVKQLVNHPLPKTTLLNVNIPPVAENAIMGVKITRQGLRRYAEQFEKRVDPRGNSYYWLAGELVTEIEQPEHIHLPPDIPTDVQAIHHNYITITPLQYNLTDVEGFQYLQRTNWLDTYLDQFSSITDDNV
ncbi:stationary-phase survival protein SurE [Rippkaea orientalis PCC 8801]|uniref:5'-nucleotidase SurE n=1 Tax=Rippkaea orientalis (strain PCC 8801 / RF-1) TaxID=41431 RepID=B7K1Q9_RIPO1|nr:5'/3'-nucleotidase SurE [Rippkaea orientalis]ACK67601.1 stationary-phase survival protein SurE [Rippkaea orientalis PCC 8801]